ncbi:MAG: type II secretion system protein [Candidatus Omnitrophota bacterium]
MNKIKYIGFTLIEVMIVVVILGIMASIALPRLAGSKDQTIFSEAVTALNTLNAAQLRYSLEKSVYANDCSLLDVDITPKNFDSMTCTSAGVVSLTVKAAVQPAAGAYTVSVNAAGTFSCAACAVTLKRLCPNSCT